MTRRYDDQSYLIRKVGTDLFISSRVRGRTTMSASGLSLNPEIEHALNFNTFQEAADWIYPNDDAKDFEIVTRYNRMVIGTSGVPFDQWRSRVDPDLIAAIEAERNAPAPKQEAKKKKPWKEVCRVAIQKDDFKHSTLILLGLMAWTSVGAAITSWYRGNMKWTEALYESFMYFTAIPIGLFMIVILICVFFNTFYEERNK